MGEDRDLPAPGRRRGAPQARHQDPVGRQVRAATGPAVRFLPLVGGPADSVTNTTFTNEALLRSRPVAAEGAIAAAFVPDPPPARASTWRVAKAFASPSPTGCCVYSLPLRRIVGNRSGFRTTSADAIDGSVSGLFGAGHVSGLETPATGVWGFQASPAVLAKGLPCRGLSIGSCCGGRRAKK